MFPREWGVMETSRGQDSERAEPRKNIPCNILDDSGKVWKRQGLRSGLNTVWQDVVDPDALALPASFKDIITRAIQHAPRLYAPQEHLMRRGAACTAW